MFTSHPASIRRLRPRTTGFAMLGAAAILLTPAAQPFGAREGLVQHYQLEVIIFAQPEGISIERPPYIPVETVFDTPAEDQASEDIPGDEAFVAHETSEAATDTQPADATAIPIPEGFFPPTAPRFLEAAAATLANSRYPVLWHQSWVQPAAERGGTDLTVLAALGAGVSTPGLSGTVSLSAARFLHLGVAVRWHTEDGLLVAELDQRRRVRSDSEHYFDHPRLGVLVRVTPVSDPTPEAVLPDTTAPDEP